MSGSRGCSAAFRKEKNPHDPAIKPSVTSVAGCAGAERGGRDKGEHPRCPGQTATAAGAGDGLLLLVISTYLFIIAPAKPEQE